MQLFGSALHHALVFHGQYNTCSGRNQYFFCNPFCRYECCPFLASTIDTTVSTSVSVTAAIASSSTVIATITTASLAVDVGVESSCLIGWSCFRPGFGGRFLVGSI